jgi:hypothetical protein
MAKSSESEKTIKKLRDDPVKIVKKFEDLKSSESDLEDQWRFDYAKWSRVPFQVSKSEGAWDNYTTNRASVLGNTGVNAIANGELQVKIDIEDEDNPEREAMTKVEDFALGILHMIDDRCIKKMEPVVLGQLAWYACMRGRYYQSLIFRTDTRMIKGKKTKLVIPEWRAYDPLNAKSVTGNDGLKLLIHKRIASKDTIMDEYDISEKQAELGSVGKDKIAVYVYLDDEFEKVVIGNDWAREPHEHKFGHTPAMGYNCGSTPLLQDDQNADAYKMQAMSIFANTRDTYDFISRLMSYHSTTARNIAHGILKMYFDSTKGGQLIKLDGNPWQKDSAVPIDVGKGQELVEMVKQSLPAGFMDNLQMVDQEESIGGLAPIVHGYSSSAVPVGTTNMLINGARQLLVPFNTAGQIGVEWLCNEAVTQYKTGPWPALKLYSNSRSVPVELKPDEIMDKWMISVKINPALPQDVLMETNIAATWKKEGLTSNQTARERLPIRSPDKEQAMINREQAQELPFIKYRDMFDALIEDGQIAEAQVLLQQILKMEGQQNGEQPGQGQPQGQGGGPVQQGITAEQGSTNAAIMGNGMPQAPDEVKQELARIGINQQLTGG